MPQKVRPVVTHRPRAPTNKMERSISGNDPRAESSTDPRPRHVPLGRDKAGCFHHYISHTETVFVIEGGEVAQTEDISRRPVDDWMAYVSDRRGWASKKYGPITELVAEMINEIDQREEAV